MNIFNKVVKQANDFKRIAVSTLPFSQIEYVLVHEDTEDNFKELYMTVNGSMPSDEDEYDTEGWIDEVLGEIDKHLDEWIELSITEENK